MFFKYLVFDGWLYIKVWWFKDNLVKTVDRSIKIALFPIASSFSLIHSPQLNADESRNKPTSCRDSRARGIQFDMVGLIPYYSEGRHFELASVVDLGIVSWHSKLPKIIHCRSEASGRQAGEEETWEEADLRACPFVDWTGTSRLQSKSRTKHEAGSLTPDARHLISPPEYGVHSR